MEPRNTLWIRWIERNNVGNDHGLAIDDFSLNVIAASVPEANTLAYLALGLSLAGLTACRRKGLKPAGGVSATTVFGQ